MLKDPTSPERWQKPGVADEAAGDWAAYLDVAECRLKDLSGEALRERQAELGALASEKAGDDARAVRLLRSAVSGDTPPMAALASLSDIARARGARKGKELGIEGEKPFDHGINERMTKEELTEALNFLDHKFFFVENTDDIPDIEWILKKMRSACIRNGVKGIIIDPYNEIADDNSLREDIHIRNLISACKQFCVKSSARESYCSL
mgnify:CR=1 FL=1